MLVKQKVSSDETVFVVPTIPPFDESDDTYLFGDLVQKSYIDNHRTPLSTTLFSLPYPGYDLSETPLVRSADVINLHWVAFFQSPVTLGKLFKLRIPVVWTLHDMWPFTGGCHYSAGCSNYERDCSLCPQLAEDPLSLPRNILEDKAGLFADANLTIVTPSHWLGQCAQRSQLFRRNRVEVIPNSLETDLYVSTPKTKSKKELGIPATAVVLLCGADSLGEIRKGFRELAAAIALALQSDSLREMVTTGGLRLLTLGPETTELKELGIPVTALGHLVDDIAIARAYSAADLFLLPSQEDNLPNMMLEAMSCGTPVLAFEIGGVPDAVTDGITGHLVASGNVEGYAAALVELVMDKSQRELMSDAARKTADSKYSLKVQADRYHDLYQDLLSSKNLANQSGWGAVPARPLIPDAEVGSATETIRDKMIIHALKTVLPTLHRRVAGVTDSDTYVGQLQYEIEALRSSRCWRLTKPLRWVMEILRG